MDEKPAREISGFVQFSGYVTPEDLEETAESFRDVLAQILLDYGAVTHYYVMLNKMRWGVDLGFRFSNEFSTKSVSELENLGTNIVQKVVERLRQAEFNITASSKEMIAV